MRPLVLLCLVALVAGACRAGPDPAPGAEPPPTSAAAGDPDSTSTTVTTTATTTTTTTAPTTTSAPSTTTTTRPLRPVREDARAVILAGLPGSQLDPSTAGHLQGGGRALILFAKNLATRDQVRALTSAAACAAGEPILVAVDQEPGRVDRLAPLGIPSPDPMLAPSQLAEEVAAMSAAMADLGINVDLAPVVDVARDGNPVLAGRSMGATAEEVAERGVAVIEALQANGVVATAKHFPGHGLSAVDPHKQVTPIDAGLEELAAVDFPPFHAAVAAGVDMVMVGHPIYSALDPELPASLAPGVLALLRDEFRFGGVAVTDAVSMAGVRAGRTVEEITVAALAAGEDLVLVDHPGSVEPAVAAVVGAVETGELDRLRLADAADRVRDLAAGAAPVECLEP